MVCDKKRLATKNGCNKKLIATKTAVVVFFISTDCNKKQEMSTAKNIHNKKRLVTKNDATKTICKKRG